MQWDTDELKARFGTKEGEVPLIEYIDMFSDTNSRIVVVAIDPPRRIIRHQDEAPDLTLLPSVDNPQAGQYAKNFDTDKSTQKMELFEEVNATFAIVTNGAAVIDCTIVFRKVPGTYVGRLELERLNDRVRMDRQSSLEDSRTAGFKMGNFNIVGEKPPV